MKFLQLSFLHLILIILFQIQPAYTQKQVNTRPDSQPVIPGVSGFGVDTKGGRGGVIIRVSNLNKDGEGSLREAISAEGPRIIVFEVAGVIDLEQSVLQIENPFISIAGQTAPFPGITIIKGGLRIATHDVIIQHIRVRPGEAGQPKNSGWEVDGIATAGGAYRVIVDHCSLTWATDENLSASGPRFAGLDVHEWRKNTSHEIVFSNCIVAEGLSNSTHRKGEHSKGTLIHDNATEILLTGNLYANNTRRNPFCKGGTRVAILNNYIYNPGTAAIHYKLVPAEWKGHEWVEGQLVIAGNLIEFGPDTKKTVSGAKFHNGPVEVYWEDNILLSPVNTEAFSGPHKTVEKAACWPAGFELLPASEIKEHVLLNAGAFPWMRDDVDSRIVAEIRSGSGKIIDSENEVGGYPAVAPVYKKFNEAEWDLISLTKKAAL